MRIIPQVVCVRRLAVGVEAERMTVRVRLMYTLITLNVSRTFVNYGLGNVRHHHLHLVPQVVVRPFADKAMVAEAVVQILTPIHGELGAPAAQLAGEERKAGQMPVELHSRKAVIRYPVPAPGGRSKTAVFIAAAISFPTFPAFAPAAVLPAC